VSPSSLLSWAQSEFVNVFMIYLRASLDLYSFICSLIIADKAETQYSTGHVLHSKNNYFNKTNNLYFRLYVPRRIPGPFIQRC
jgi:hypothetical protein